MKKKSLKNSGNSSHDWVERWEWEAGAWKAREMSDETLEPQKSNERILLSCCG